MSDLLDDTDIGQLTKSLYDNTADLMDIWAMRPDRRCEFGHMEINDIVATAFALGTLLKELNRYVANQQPKLRVVQ